MLPETSKNCVQFVERRPGVGPRRPELPQDRLDGLPFDDEPVANVHGELICDGGSPLPMVSERRMPSSSSRVTLRTLRTDVRWPQVMCVLAARCVGAGATRGVTDRWSAQLAAGARHAT